MVSTEIVLKGRASKATDETPKVTVDLPESYEEAVSLWGEEVCAGLFAGAVFDAAARFARSRFEGGIEVSVIQGALANWKPGVRMSLVKPGAAKVSRTLNSLSKMSEEELEAFRAKLREDPRFAEIF